MVTVLELLESGYSWTREQLSQMTGLDDRAVRAEIRRLRRDGVPIVPLKYGGYKLVETEEEKKQLLHLYWNRAMDELTTYAKLYLAFYPQDIEGQMKMSDLVENLEGGK